MLYREALKHQSNSSSDLAFLCILNLLYWRVFQPFSSFTEITTRLWLISRNPALSNLFYAFCFKKAAFWMSARTKQVTIFSNNLLNHCITISISNAALKYYSIFHSFVHPQLYETIKDGCLILSRACFLSCPTPPLLKQHFAKYFV